MEETKNADKPMYLQKTPPSRIVDMQTIEEDIEV